MRWNYLKLFVIVIAILAVLPATAQNNGKNSRKELIQQIDAYRQKEILPIMKQQKELLDSKIDKSSLDELNKLRSRAAELKNNGKMLRSQMRDAKKSNNTKQIEELKDAMKKNAAEHKTLAAELKPIVKNNKDAIKDVSDVIKEKSVIWREEIKKITDAFREAHKNDKQDADKKKNGKMLKKHDQKQNRMGDGKGTKFDGKRAVARFLLWDGASPIE